MSEQEEEPDGETVECWNCGGEGVRNLYDEDPFWYGKNDTETCDICEGKGFYIVPYEESENVQP